MSAAPLPASPSARDHSGAAGAAPTATLSPTSQTAARVAMAAAVLFLLLLAALHALEPEFDPSWRMISDYELGRFGAVMALAFASLAVGSASLGVAVRPHVRTAAGWIGLGCLFASAVAQLGGGIFTTDPITAAADQRTAQGTLHGLSALIGIPSMALATLLLSRSLAPDAAWAPVRERLVIAAGLLWLSVAVFGVSVAILLPRGGGTFGPEVVIGWQNRLMLVAYCVWILAVAWRMAAASPVWRVMAVRARPPGVASSPGRRT